VKKSHKKICIVGQGPLFDVDKFTENLSEVDVIISTWKGEQHKAGVGHNNDRAQNILPNGKKRTILFNDPPPNAGKRNVNLQTLSTLKGVEYALQNGYDFVFKCRNDVRILDYKKLHDSLDFTKFNFLAWTNHGPGYLIDYYFGGPTALFKSFLESCLDAPDNIRCPEIHYTERFKEFSLKNKIDNVNYFLKDAIKYEIFSGGRHNQNGTSSIFKDIIALDNSNTRTGRFNVKNNNQGKQVLISHRGNLNGKNKNRENSPQYIREALDRGFEVEIDVWYKNKQWYLGHDEPNYLISLDFLKNPKLWCHAKNKDALYEMLEENIHCFWHEEDECVLTSKGIMWAHPKVIPPDNSIAVLPEVSTPSNYWAKKRQIKRCYGVCSDYIENYL